MPKPVHLTNGYFGVFDAAGQIPLPEGRESSIFYDEGQNALLLTVAPFFHLMGFLTFIVSLFHGVAPVMGPEKPLSVDFITKLIGIGKPTIAMLPPSVLEDLSVSDKGIEAVKTLRSIYFGGAPLSSEAGNKLRQYTKIITAIGSTEVGLIPSLIPENDDDWSYFEWNPYYSLEMRDVGDGLYEMVIPRPETRQIHGIFHTFPHLNEYRTNDLYTRHPSNPNLWKYHGRFDDVIVLSNGEKFNPITMEKIIETSPLVSRAVVAGQGRFQSALLVQPYWENWDSDIDHEQFVDQIWGHVEKGNRSVAAHGRVMRDRIGISSRDKPFQTTPKGTTQRHKVLNDYKEEINRIYARDGADLLREFSEAPTAADIREYIRGIVTKMVRQSGIDDKDDFYKLGLDSLQTIQLCRILQSAIRPHFSNANSINLTADLCYSNPTVEKLSQLVLRIVNGEKEEEKLSRPEKLNSLIEKYTAKLPDRRIDDSSLPGKSTVILTGTTGSLGTYLLDVFLRDQDIVKVYCFNRSDAKARQEKGFHEKGLVYTPEELEKLELLEVSYGDAKFGLSDTKYHEMLDSVDTIVHNAWRVDFNNTVDSFEDPHIKGVSNFVNFSLKSRYHAHFHFVSSISTVGAWDSSVKPLVPEEPMEDCNATLEQGYGESKYISESICVAASRKAGVQTTILRVGQIAGPTTEKGQWNIQEWVPTIVATSKEMGLVPDRLGATDVDWIPVVRTFFLLTH